MGLSSTPSELGGPSTSAARSDRIGQCAQPGRNSWAHWPWPVVMDGVTAPARGQAIPVESLRSSEEPTSTEGSRLPASAPDRSRCGLRPISTRGSRRPSLPPHTPGTDHLVAPRSLQKETDGLGVILVAVDQGLAGAQMSATGEDFTIPTVSVTVTDIVPLASGDSTGAGLALAALPLIMGGIGGAMMLSTAIKGLRRQLYSALIYSVMGGLVVTGILQGWFDVMQGSYWMNALIIGLEVAALSSTVIGAKNAFGNVGMAVVSVTMLLVGNPLSGATVPAYFLPSPWGAVGRLLPPGAALDLLRNVSYFPQAPSMTSWLVLLAWLALGIALNWVAKLRRVTLPARREAREAAQPAEATASA